MGCSFDEQLLTQTKPFLDVLGKPCLPYPHESLGPTRCFTRRVAHKSRAFAALHTLGFKTSNQCDRKPRGPSLSRHFLTRRKLVLCW